MRAILIGVIVAFIAGIAIGIQSTISSRSGGIIGSVRTGLLINLTGGGIAGIVILFMLIIKGPSSWKITLTPLIMCATAGFLGILIIMSVSFSLQRVGVTAGFAIIILGQMLLSVIIDTKGIGGIEPIALSFKRISGLFLLAISVYFLLPKQ